MLVHKISNPDDKESKTERSNGEAGALPLVKEQKPEESPEQTARPWVRDALESGMEDYLQVTGNCESGHFSSIPSSK